MPPNRFESEVGNFLEGSHGDRTHIKRAGHHTVTPLCGTLLKFRMQFPDGANRRKLKNRVISTIRFQYLKYSQGNCMRNRWTPRCLPPEKSHVIPSGPHSATARKPRNFNDPISIFETSSEELRAKLLCPWDGRAGRAPPPGGRRVACGAWSDNASTRRAKLVARTASGRAGLAPHAPPDLRPPRGLQALVCLQFAC